MTFYEHQDRARKKTWLLLSYFLLAVLFIVLAVNAVIFFVIFQTDQSHSISLQQWISSPMCWGTVGITLAVIVGGSFMRYQQIKSGGDAVAAMAGGRLVSSDTQNPLEKRLLNITEEMAIASGTHVPRVYLLENEAGINAFVAGYSANNTILAVTQGALNNLTRDELQGVIGHEFSHVLNSDTRINLNLIAMLAGILLIGKIGESLLRSGRYSRHRYTSHNNKNASGNFALGLALMAIGYIGLFFGRLIKAAISRQREFLADASSVQFTRNPYGIGGALYKIGQLQQGSHLESKHAEDMSHMCFGETLSVNFATLLATHPPIPERLAAIDPSLATRMKSRFQQGKLTLADEQTPFSQESGERANQSDFASAAIATSDTSVTTNSTQFSVDSRQLKRSIGTLTPEQVAQAESIHQAIPRELLAIAHHKTFAATVIYGLILTTMSSHGKEAIELIENSTDANTAEQTRQIYQLFHRHPESLRLPLLDIAIATLENSSPQDKQQIVKLTQALIAIDEKLTLYEFIYVSLVEKYLAPAKPKQRQIKSFSSVQNAVAVLLAAVSLASGNPPSRQLQVFQQSLTGFTGKDYSKLLQEPPSLPLLVKAVEVLNRLSPLLKQPLIDACVDCVLHDQQVTANEANLLRAICERLDCPMPILVPDQSQPST